MEVKGISLGKGRHFEIDRKASDIIIELVPHEKFKSIHLYGHLIGCPAIKHGERIGFVAITDIRGNKREFPLKNSINIGDWKTDLGDISITQFQKKITLVGEASYPDAYREFSVKLDRASFEVSELDKLKRIEVHFNLDKGKLVIWGLKGTY